MARKHLLDTLINVDAAPATEIPSINHMESRPVARRVGVIGAMSDSIESMEANLKDARSKIEGGDLIVDLSPDLIDPSFISERVPDTSDTDALVESIRMRGQDTPVLVRPSPQHEGRYQLVFGHRRTRAAQILGRPVRAMIRRLTDDELVVAQGQENLSRLNLSYIERAIFAAKLEARGFTRDIICKSLNVEKSAVSYMISIVNGIPDDLIAMIGPAQGIGRRLWMDLEARLGEDDWDGIKTELEWALAQVPRTSEERFRFVAKFLANRSRVSAKKMVEPASFKINRKPGLIRINFKEGSMPEDDVRRCLAELQAVFAKYEVKS